MKALIAVDVQNDFLPGGALAVPNGDGVVEPLLHLAHSVDIVIATADSHPANHSSFAFMGGKWPIHCVQGTDGQRLDPRIYEALDAMFPKGQDALREEYSGLSGDLDEFLREEGVTELLIGGLATDYCVKATVLDAIERGYDVTLYLPGCRGIDAETTEQAIEDMHRAGATVVR